MENISATFRIFPCPFIFNIISSPEIINILNSLIIGYCVALVWLPSIQMIFLRFIHVTASVIFSLYCHISFNFMNIPAWCLSNYMLTDTWMSSNLELFNGVLANWQAWVGKNKETVCFATFFNLWCKCFHHGQFQVVQLNNKLAKFLVSFCKLTTWSSHE